MPTNIEKALMDANAVMTQFVPLIGIIGVGVRATIALLRQNGLNKEADEFEVEMAKYDAQLKGFGDAIADFRARYPRT